MYLILILCLFFANSQSQENDTEIFDDDYLNCEKHTSCDSCFMENKLCTWCSHIQHHSTNNSFPPCSLRRRLLMFGCPENNILKIGDPEFKKIDDRNFTDANDQDGEEPVQIKPQHVSVIFSPFDTQIVEFEYRPARNYPLDLYVLLDLTYSMKDDRETFVKLNPRLLENLSNFTKYYRLGFGSFADKPIMPYISTSKRHKNNPCSAVKDKCEMTYDFRHMLDFTNDTNKFTEALGNSSITANLDNADGGFDALMQVLVCGDRIGWNSKSRKIVLIATDSLPHFAGDGKLGGAVQNNDKQCHLNDDGFYSKAEEMDYPSLEQIYRILIEKKISVIFAVIKEVESIYIHLEKLLPEYAFVGRLEKDSKNILELVKQGYENIVRTVSFDVSEDEDFEFELYSNCGREKSPFYKTSKCTDVTYGNTYKFKMEIKYKEYRRQGYISFAKKTVHISESLLGQKLITIDVDITTNCDCSKTDANFNTTCPSNARFECGKCNCLPGWYGKDCQCNMDKIEAFDHVESCRDPDSNSICSRNGECFCGSCECDAGWTGKFCNCRECPKNRDNGVECTSRNKGRCSCGTCICRKGWSGEDCSCSDSTCISPWNEDLCSGNGVCRCGTCKCIEKNGRNYTGKYCETCSTCENPACSLYEPCVSKEMNLKCDVENPCFSPKGIMYTPSKISEYYNRTEEMRECVIRIDDELSFDFGCTYIYTYEVQKDWNTALFIYTRECPSFYQKGSVMLSLGTVFAFALTVDLVILWKVYDYYRHRKEYRKFMAEQKKALFKENPLYRSPVSLFIVPKEFRDHTD